MFTFSTGVLGILLDIEKLVFIPMGLFTEYIIFMMLINSPDFSIKILPKTMRGESKNFRGLFNSFTHSGYLLGIIFSLYFSIYFSLINLVFFQWFFSIRLNLDLTNVFFVSATLFTIYYFMYHVIKKNLSVKVASARVQLYVAYSVTISIILAALSLNNILMSFITWLGIGFTWLTYFLRRIEDEDEVALKNDSNEQGID
jgi:hypothetical protein